MKKILVPNCGFYFKIYKTKNFAELWSGHIYLTKKWHASITGSEGKPAPLKTIVYWLDEQWGGSVPYEFRLSTLAAPILYKEWGQYLGAKL